MNKKFGVRGEVKHFPFKDLQETIYNKGGIEIEIDNGILSVGVDDEAALEEAKGFALLYLKIWNMRQDIKTTVQFSSSWRTNALGHQDYTVKLEEDSLALHDRLIITTNTISIPMRVSVISQQQVDTASFSHDSMLFEKARKYSTLKSILYYFDEEVLDDERPLYGIYKALEAIISYYQETYKLSDTDARKKLAALAGQSLSYVNDIIQTTQVKRHHKTSARRKLDDNECRNRAHLLIDLFARSLP